MSDFITPPVGLTAAEVAIRVAEGRTNQVEKRDGRTLGQIIRANVFTPFNALLVTLFVVIMTTGRWQNALFGNVVILNSAVGVTQELRARRTLTKLAVLNAPVARAIRDGVEHEFGLEQIVADDLLALKQGDQICADGVVRAANGLEVDESLLTGESDPIPKRPGDQVLSGSIVVAGQGTLQALGVGPDAYAARLAAEASRFSLTKSELQQATWRLLRWIAVVMVVTAPLIAWRQFTSPDAGDWRDSVTGTVAALIGMVPDGLVLLTSFAFIIGVVTLARRNTLVQELPAVEVLARVDVVCLDKTGTLTDGEITLEEVVALGAHGASTGADDSAVSPQAATALATLAAPLDNATALAVAAKFDAVNAAVPTATVPFSSARKWSAAQIDTGTWVLGAPEFLAHPDSPARLRADQIAAGGNRVVLLAHTTNLLTDDSLPTGLEPAALLTLGEQIRPDAAETLHYFAEQGVTIKVISGDNPRTVGAVAARVGVPGVTGADDAVDARELPDDPTALVDVLREKAVFGRVTPAQKRAFVGALQADGHVVAMTGDGVNDALALKDADIGVAMGNGSAATRAVAQLVLLDSKFAHLPRVVAEGRRVINNIERAANLFLVRNAYTLLMALMIIFTGSVFPMVPIQMTLISTLTIGVPGFFLALAPGAPRYSPGFMGRVLRFALPVGVTTGLVGYTAYRMTSVMEPGASHQAAGTTASLAVLAVGLWVVFLKARPLTPWKVALLVGLVGAALLAVLVPWLASSVFLMEVTGARVLTALVVAMVGAVIVTMVDQAGRRRRHRS